ncbi:MAG: hypothetical protein HKN20_07145, partial [Gemmatimonadetes bacterium]|nr:hypothetical protein [Gemmatimonadota bacterium]
MLPFFVAVALLASLLFAVPAPAQDDDSRLESLIDDEDSYLASLIEEARRAELARDPYWHTILHYKRGLFGVRSLVDDAAFFAAANGKRDPAAELEATLRAFFEGPPAEGEKHPVCRFVLRFEWLKE